LAECRPKVVDKLTPEGKVDPTADHRQGLANLLPSLLQSLGGKPSGDDPGQVWLDGDRGIHAGEQYSLLTRI
jgi:hypothetical protein